VQVPNSLLKPLGKMTRLEVVDMRYVHQEVDQFGTPAPCWSMEKGTTMSNIVQWEKALKRKGAAIRVLKGESDGMHL